MSSSSSSSSSDTSNSSISVSSSSSSSDEEKAPRVNVLESAMAKETELKKLMAEPKEEWDKHSALTKNMYVWKYLGVSDKVVHADIKTLTLKGLRALYLNRWVIKPTDRSDYLATLLLRGKLMCKHCIRVNSQGSFTAKSANVEQHGKGGKHVRKLEDAKKTKVKKTLKSAVSSSAAAPAAATSASDPAEREEVVSYQPGLEVFYGRQGKAPGFLDDSERATSILAANAVAEGVAYTSVPGIFDRSAFKLMENARSGMFQSRALRESKFPKVIQAMRGGHATELADEDFLSASVDGGSPVNLLDGAKVIAVCMNGSRRSFLLDLIILGSRHENTINQAFHLDRSFRAAGITPKQLRYIVADSAALNAASVDFLNERLGWNIEYRRCVPHLLQLIMVALMTPVENAYKFSSFLTSVRGFYNAGGGSARRGLLTEAGVILGALDFVETRWFSLLTATTALVSDITPTDFDRARRYLGSNRYHLQQELSFYESGLHDIKKFKKMIPLIKEQIQEIDDALAEPDVPRPLWDALYEITEQIKQEDAPDAVSEENDAEIETGGGGGGDSVSGVKRKRDATSSSNLRSAGKRSTTGTRSAGTRSAGTDSYGTSVPSQSSPNNMDAKPQPLLDWLANDEHFAVALMVKHIVAGVSSIFNTLQGGPDWSNRFEDMKAADVEAVTKPIRRFLSVIERLKSPGRRNELLDDVLEETTQHHCKILDAAVTYGELDSKDLPRSRDSGKKSIDALRPRLYTLLNSISTAVLECPGLEKMEESLCHLEVKFRYDPTCKQRPSKMSKDLPRGEVYESLGVPEEWHIEVGMNKTELVDALIDDWNKYCSFWIPPPSGRVFSPSAVTKFWKSSDSKRLYPHLATLALLRWATPTNAAQAERAFRIVTAADDPHKSTTGDLTFLETIFLRVNKASVKQLAVSTVDELDFDKDGMHRFLREGEVSVKRAKEAAVASSAFDALHEDHVTLKKRRKKTPGGTSEGKGGEEEEEEEEVEEGKKTTSSKTASSSSKTASSKTASSSSSKAASSSSSRSASSSSSNATSVKSLSYFWGNKKDKSGKEDDDDDEEEEEEEESDPKKAGKIAPLVLDSEEEAAIEEERAAGRRAREALLRKPQRKLLDFE